MQRYPASEGYLRKIPVTSTDKFLSPLWRLGKFAFPLNRYFSQITLTNRIYLYNISDIYLYVIGENVPKITLFLCLFLNGI
jgi:hypothetical protein